MNDEHNPDIDKFLDDIIFSKAAGADLAELMRNMNREELLNELILHQTAASLIQRHEVISQVKAIHNEFLGKRNGFTAEENSNVQVVPIRQRRFRIVWAAAAVLILIPALAFMYLTVTNNTEKLYNGEYQAYHFNVDRSAENATASSVATLYQQGQFDAAVTQYANITSPSVTEQMAAGFAFMELGRFKESSQLFERVLQRNTASRNKAYNDEAEYYLALSYLKLDEAGKAYALFNKIYSDKDHTYNGTITKWFIIRLKWLT
jgi:tetratricopeptide (TPR) repeat protein